ncbi:MAG: PEP-utilizing enzyme [Ilumatobacteraceae bacterium]
MDRWITDTPNSARFPYYTRANADEVGPDPFSPLGWSLVWMRGCNPGVAKGFAEFGVVDISEYDLAPLQVFGNRGGYFYNPLSLSRLMGERMPGATAEAIDKAYFGDHPGVPPHEPHPDDVNETQSAKLAETMGWVMTCDSYPLQHAASDLAKQVVADRPDFTTLSNAELVAYARDMASKVEQVWLPYTVVCLGASLPPGAVQAICEAIGRSEDAVKALSAVGSVESAEASFSMWDMSRLVNSSPSLQAAFDAGVEGVLDRIDTSDPAGAQFLALWADLMTVHGHRAPNEWDTRPDSWTTRPAIALDMIHRLRAQSDDRSPHVAKAAAVVERERVSADLLDALAGDAETRATMEMALKAAANWFGWREQGKYACIRLIHEVKLAMYELGHRMVAAGVIADHHEIFNLLDDELDDFLTEPAKYAATIADREVSFQALYEVDPPYIVGNGRGDESISTWPKRNAGGGELAKVGDVLQGGPGAPGVITGRARIVLDPMVAPDMEITDILVAPTTDPSWAPLFLSVGGVVVNVGAVGSHAAIVSRELGVPCAVSVQQATSRIPEGALISVDGSTGTVTILEV